MNLSLSLREVVSKDSTVSFYTTDTCVVFDEDDVCVCVHTQTYTQPPLTSRIKENGLLTLVTERRTKINVFGPNSSRFNDPYTGSSLVNKIESSIFLFPLWEGTEECPNYSYLIVTSLKPAFMRRRRLQVSTLTVITL